MANKSKKNTEPENYPVLVKLRGSTAECTGEHMVFIDGGRITFMDGEVTVTNGQYETLKNAGYALSGEPVIESDPEPDAEPNNPDNTGDPENPENLETGEGKEGGAE